MIPKGLKVGDTYLEGKLVYKIVGVVDADRGIYSGEWTGETLSSLPEENTEEVKEEITEERVDYMAMQYAQLKKLCAERGLNAVGSKADLIARLEG